MILCIFNNLKITLWLTQSIFEVKINQGNFPLISVSRFEVDFLFVLIEQCLKVTLY